MIEHIHIGSSRSRPWLGMMKRPCASDLESYAWTQIASSLTVMVLSKAPMYDSGHETLHRMELNDKVKKREKESSSVSENSVALEDSIGSGK